MTMDFSRLHIYTPPQCVPENTGYTYSLSSSYSSAALDFESQHKLEPVFDSPRMSRRSLRLAITGHFSDDGFLDSSRSKVSYSGGGRAYRTLNRTSHKQTALTSQQTPSKTQSDSSLILGQNSFHSCASDVSLMSTLLDESSIQEKTLVDSFWGLDEDRDLKGGDTTVVQGNGDLNTAETQTSMANGYICNDCSILSQRKDVLTTYSSSSHSHSPTPSSTVYSYDKTKRHKSGRAATGAFWWLGTGWYHLVTLMSLLNVFILTRCLPKLLKLLLLLIPFLLLLGLWYWSPSGLLLSLPGLISSDRQVESDVTPTPSSALDQVATEQQDESEAHLHPSSESVSGVFDLERVISLEKRLALLSDSCQKTSQQYDERHRQLLGLYGKLQEQLARARDEEGASTRITNLFDQRMSILKQDLQQSWEEKEQNQNEYLALHQSHESRIADLEGLLQIIAAKTEEVRQKRETSTPAAVSQESDDHSLLLSEVKRLELELNQIKADLLGVKTCHSKCEALDSLQDTVDARVREAVKTLIYGSREAEMPESLLQWLSSQYVQHGDLQGRLASLEQRVFKNITSYTSQTKQMPTAQVVTSAVNGAGVTGITEEQVHAIVNNALRLYSQDRTGLVDYALESGGGSILSTRCSETYETKTALMSLFGVPLWYFSQSPRVVIQPDVYPGNCWAFKGSQGYLVIRLSLTIIPSSFTLEHIPKALSPTGHISSAPRNFTVYGLEDEYQEEGKLLGRYTYEEDGESFQTFPVTEENDKAYQIIEVRVLSNWGHPEYTCLYRFRVHGEPYKK
nr:PREDICTED: SUN domain-containing protein 1 isoform X6 [Lepisosteus oculatus]